MIKIDGLFDSSFARLTGLSWIVPVGLSFYTLQMVAYLVDIYKGKVTAQRNIFKFALFASFFPQIIQGPIPRYEALSGQLYEGNEFDFDEFVGGLQLILWGFFLKFMIADKAGVVVNTVFDDYASYAGGYVLFAGVLYSLQLYADFLACTTLAQGVSQMFGIRLSDNFERPYFATSIKDFWRRWHISLSSWLRDYVYIPLGGSRKGAFRKYLNVVITFAVSGLWHGDSVKFVFWGLLHAFYQIAERPLDKVKVPVILRRLGTFVLAMIGWIIFRADSLDSSFAMLKSMVTVWNPQIWTDGSLLELGLGGAEMVVLGVSLLALLVVSCMQERGVKVRDLVSSMNVAFRWVIYLLAIWAIWIFGTYGFGFNASDFIYGGF
ncbi:MAG: MBOAT family protein [Butyrivibrio sp.]|uniref:MBOAT family O-acyltransferase n=1 Tax=Butyrivibrio sp. TaxID=28121 RepID=UPI001B3D9CBD|nr:MBOAT family O-acyltransferase [Butyrivibrio sp.]MBP3784353.1 MBOAT family protein [Butyrivibrio sp.]